MLIVFICFVTPTQLVCLQPGLAIFFFFFVKDRRINILDFSGHIVSVATSQLCYYDLRAAIRQDVNEHGYVLIKLYLQHRQWTRFDL